MTSAPTSRPMWRFPDRQSARLYLKYAAVVGLLFFTGYGATDWLGGRHAHPLHLYAQTELAIPLVPAMILPYVSINLLFLLPPFHLQAEQLRVLGRQMITATFAATACFLAAPTALGFPPAGAAAGSFGPLYWFFEDIQYPVNCVPSLHVAFASLIVAALLEGAKPRWRLVLAAWLGLVVSSTVLAHQHHLIDVASGAALASLARLVTAQRPASTLASAARAAGRDA